MGAGMICLEGTGALSHVSLRHKPEVFNEPCVFAALPREGRAGRASSRGRSRAGSCSGCRTAATGRRRDVRPAPLPLARVPGSLPVRDGCARGRRGAAKGRAHRLEPVRARRRGQLVPARGAALEYRFANPARRPEASSPSTPATSWRSRRARRPCAPCPAASCSGAAARRRPWDEAPSACGRRCRARVQSRLVPRRLVRPPDAGVEGRRGGRLLRPRGRRRGAPAPGATLFVPFTLAPGAHEDDRAAALLVRGDEPAAHGRRPRGDGPPADRRLPAVVRGALLRHRRGRRPSGASATASCARKRRASPTASTTRPCRPRWSRPWPPTSRSSSRRPCCARPTGGCGPGRAAATAGAAATAPAPTSGTTRRRCRTCSRRSSGRCARRSSASRRTRAATRRSAPRCRSGRPRTTSTPRPTASSAGS